MSFKRQKRKSETEGEATGAELLIDLSHGGTSVITGVVASGREGRVEIYVDGHKAAFLTIDQIVALGLAKDQAWTAKTAELVMAANLETKVLDKALRLLNFSARSSQALRDKLVREEKFESHIVDKIIERLSNSGLLDDQAYAEQIARSGLTGRGWGSRRVEQELHKRRVPRELIGEALAKIKEEGETDEVETAFIQAQKRWNRLNNIDPRTRKTRIYAWLARRGFGPDVIGQVMKRLGQEAPEDAEDAWPTDER